jgi:metallopeptidase MepB
VFLENFVWQEDVLAKLSCHYTTLKPEYLDQWRKDNPGRPDPPASIPAELVQALSRSRYLNEAQYYCHQL